MMEALAQSSTMGEFVNTRSRKKQATMAQQNKVNEEMFVEQANEQDEEQGNKQYDLFSFIVGIYDVLILPVIFSVDYDENLSIDT